MPLAVSLLSTNSGGTLFRSVPAAVVICAEVSHADDVSPLVGAHGGSRCEHRPNAVFRAGAERCTECVSSRPFYLSVKYPSSWRQSVIGDC